jgi:lipopolysaccharide assembly outer membrane protein LptD (OstA)
MSKLRAMVVLLLCCCGLPAALRGAEDSTWTIESDEERSLTFDFKSATITYTNTVTIRYGDSTLTAKRARINQESGEVVAEGQVRLQQANEVWYGERIEYNFKTRKILASDFRAGQPPYFIRGDALAGDQASQVYVLADGIVTTDDYAEPGYRIKAKALSFAPGDYIEAKDAILYLHNTPVFWFPKWRRSLKRHPNHWVATPGYRSKYGPYLLNTYEWFWSDRLDGAVHVDGRLKRGVGAGPDLNYHLPAFGNGSVKYYYTRDEDPGEDNRGQKIDEQRQRVWFTHLGELRTNLTLRGAVRYQSDPQIIRDFFESEYHENTQPTTFGELNQLWQNFSLDLLAQPRVNNFQETVERLPDVKLTGLRQQVGPLPIYYESESSFGYYQREFAYVDTNRVAATRADTYHQLLVPWNMFGWLNLTPRAGGRFTYYGEANGGGAYVPQDPLAPPSPAVPLQEHQRTVWNTGAEVSFKASSTWAGSHNKFFEIDGVRHIVQPSVNYVWVPHPTVAPRQLPQFDYELPSAELLPITFPDYNSIDSIDSQNVMRFGLENKLQTKRSDGVENVIHSSIYTDWRLRPRSDQDTFADLYSKLDVKPFHWLTLYSEISYDINDRLWDQVNHAATFAPNDSWSWTVGERYLRTGAFYPTNGTSLIYSSLYLKFSPNYAGRALLYYDAREHHFQNQTYTIYRDFRSWTAAVTFRYLNNSGGGQKDYGVAFTFSSKAFPRYQVGDDINKPSQSLGF